MLKIICGDFEYKRFDGLLGSCEGWYMNRRRVSWFETDFGKRLLRDIDKVVDIQGNKFIREEGVIFGFNDISHGSKTVLCMAYADDINSRIFDASFIGSNLYPYVMELAKEKDIFLMVPGIYDFPKDIHGVVLNGGEAFNSSKELMSLVLKYKKCYIASNGDRKLLCSIYRDMGDVRVMTGESYTIRY